MARHPIEARPRIPVQGAAGPAQTRPGTQRHAAAGATGLFVGYVILVFVEYGGISSIIPMLDTLRFSTVLCYGLFILVLAQLNVGALMQHKQTKLLLAFIVFTILSVIWAVIQMKTLQSIRPLVDYMAFFALTAMLIDRQSRIDFLSWLFLGISTMLVARNIDKLVSTERTGHFDAPYFMGDGNDFAWSMVITLPLILNLVLGKRSILTRLLGLIGVGCCLVGVVGSGSRGAALGLGAALLYYWIVMSRRKALGAVALAVLVAGVLVLAPTPYFDRLKSIGGYQQDNSAQSRLQVWRASIKMAIDRPLGVGAGNFSSAYGRFYMPPGNENTVMWASQRWLSAHSIYFKVLGEYGILGLLLILAVLRRNLSDNAAVRRRMVQNPDPASNAVAWPALLNMSIVGYAVCGIFLGGLNYPHLFLLSALTVAQQRSAGMISGSPIAAAPGIARP